MTQSMKNLQDLFVDSLKDLYDAGHQVIRVLPKMAEQAMAEELKQGLKDQIEAKQKQLGRLDQIFKELNMQPEGKHCKGMDGILEEGKDLMNKSTDPAIKDAAMIASAQKAEHYEIAGYGTARAYAKALGHQKVADMLDQTANEEGNIDKRLTRIAEDHINLRARD